MTDSFVSAVTAPSETGQPSLWFVFSGFRLLVQDDSERVQIPLVSDPQELSVPLERYQFMGFIKRENKLIGCYSGEVPKTTQPPLNMAFLSLRSLFGRLDEGMFAIAGRAVQIVEWDRTHQYCGHCGSSVVMMEYERAKQCPQCNHTSYPRLAPAIIVSIERPAVHGTELLLARNHRHPGGLFSVLAGFVEPGETLEDCVHREVREEVGIEVKNINYFGSQPWPFPNSLMIAFTAEYAGGHLSLEEEEIAEAGWFKADSLPRIPPSISIARQLIDAFVEKNLGNTDISK